MTLQELISSGGYFQGYAYAYPHKMAYAALSPRIPLHELWAGEEKSALFLYAHVPFCEMRCGFCNLFTTTHPGQNLVTAYLDAFQREAEAVSECVGSAARMARVAIGGGTPTYLEPAELERLFRILDTNFAITPTAPKAIELSPATTTPDRLSALRDWGITRVSLGVQSFVESETRALGRHQSPKAVREALTLLRAAQFPVLNIDLIYGAQGQTAASWRTSLEEALIFSPEEIFLYPLYVRPLTGLGRHGDEPADNRQELYRIGRDLLKARGYRQISMRLFRRVTAALPEGPMYCCQEDGMIGLGPGARSYTKACHYSSEWAVGRAGVREIIQDYVEREADRFRFAEHGCTLPLEEQKRRYVIKSLLRIDGLDLRAYREEFGTEAMNDFPELKLLESTGFTTRADDFLQLNEEGLACSDVIGPWLFSGEMRSRMAAFELV